MHGVGAGITLDRLVAQVKNTASWLWDEPRAAAVTHPLDTQAEPLETMLTAHFATVATFVPTDVDARIRHHVWQAIEDEATFASACAAIERIERHDVRLVSARVIETEERPLSGHDGEWLAVRAGAIGRGCVRGFPCDELVARVEAELDREERALVTALEGNDAVRAFSMATIVAHNLGDLSRVVVDWPRHAALDDLRLRWTRLGHADGARPRRAFVIAGALNKARMAHENHRFLPLRAPRALRTSRALLLPIGPWFDAWGETVARSTDLSDSDRAEVLAALLELHARDANQEGCLRAIAGLHRATRGGIERFVPDLPARLRKDALRGRVRDALDVSAAAFAAKMTKKYRADLSAAPRVP
jgi:hypothetical protein